MNYPVKKVKCHTCSHTIECVQKPVVFIGLFGVKQEIVPQFNAPMICKKCRQDPKKFLLARTAMMVYFGWDEPEPEADDAQGEEEATQRRLDTDVEDGQTQI